MEWRRKWRKIYARLWVALRLLRLKFVRMPESPDDKSQEQMLKEILDRVHKEEEEKKGK